MKPGDIVISEDGICYMNPTGVLYHQPLSLLSSSLEGTIVPNQCRISQSEGGTTILVIEQSPTTRQIHWKTSAVDWEDLKQRGLVNKWGLGDESQHQQIFRFALPYVVFVLRFINDRFDHGKVFFRTHELRSVTDHLLHTGIVATGRFTCSTDVSENEHGSSAVTITSDVLEQFWNQWFGHDVSKETWTCDVPQMKTPWEWERASQTDSTWVFRAPWSTASHSVGDVVRHMFLPDDQDIPAHELAYQKMVRLITSKDTVHAQKDLVASSAFSVIVQKVVFTIGDTLRACRSSEGLCEGKSYTVEGFYYQKSTQRYFVALTGVKDPQELSIGRNVLCFEKLTEPQKEWVQPITQAEIEGRMIKTGMYVRKTVSKENLCEFSLDQWYRIKELRRDLDGDIQISVNLGSQNVWCYITVNQKLFSYLDLRSR